MRRHRRIGAAIAAIAALLVTTLVLLAWVSPPDLIRVGANFTAKTVCSNLLLANRDPAAVLESDVQAPGHPLLRLMRIDVDRHSGVVRAGVFGFIGRGLAVATPEFGCAVLPDGRLDPFLAHPQPLPAPSSISLPTRAGDAASPLEEVIADDGLAGPGMRAILVVRRGEPLAERYAAGFDRNTRQLGWSMTKSVTAGLIGLLVMDGRLALDRSAGLTGGGRERITLASLLSMTSGLEFNEGYGAVSDLTRMLYLRSDMAAFAAAKPLIHPIGDVWSYSSGTAVILSRIFQAAAGPAAPGLEASQPAVPQPAVPNFARTRLFEPLGMTSAVLEADASGTLVGSSYMYATPRDWARYGQLLAQDGVWQGQRILPQGFVAMMATPVAASGGEYGYGMVRRKVGQRDTPGIPSDTFWMTGHDGQYIAIIPSRQMVILRMGLTPAREGYQPGPLVAAVLAAAQQ